MARLRLAAMVLLALTGLGAVMAAIATVRPADGIEDALQDIYAVAVDGTALLWEMAIAGVNLLGVLWHSRAAAPRSPLLGVALGTVLCGVALLIMATQIPATYLAYASPLHAADVSRYGAVLYAAAWLRIAALFVIIAGWLAWAIVRHLRERQT